MRYVNESVKNMSLIYLEKLKNFVEILLCTYNSIILLKYFSYSYKDKNLNIISEE